MANVALRCTDPACAADGKVQTTKTCAVCGKPTTWTVLRVPPPGQVATVGPIYTTPMPLKDAPAPHRYGSRDAHLHQPGLRALPPRDQTDPFCGACGNATVVAKTV